MWIHVSIWISMVVMDSDQAARIFCLQLIVAMKEIYEENYYRKKNTSKSDINMQYELFI